MDRKIEQSEPHPNQLVEKNNPQSTQSYTEKNYQIKTQRISAFSVDKKTERSEPHPYKLAFISGISGRKKWILRHSNKSV